MLEKVKDSFHRIMGWTYITSGDDVVELLHPYVTGYVDWYAEKGLYLPKEFETDPSSWTNILRKIQRAFDLANTEGYEETPALKEEMEEGFVLFGKYFREMWK